QAERVRAFQQQRSDLEDAAATGGDGVANRGTVGAVATGTAVLLELRKRGEAGCREPGRAGIPPSQARRTAARFVAHGHGDACRLTRRDDVGFEDPVDADPWSVDGDGDRG